MKIDFLPLELSKFTEQLNDCINNLEKNVNNKSETLLIFNKINFYTEEFFVNNELHLQNNSTELTKIKAEHDSFLSKVRTYQIDFIEKNQETPVNLISFLKTWLKENID